MTLKKELKAIGLTLLILVGIVVTVGGWIYILSLNPAVIGPSSIVLALAGFIYMGTRKRIKDQN